MLCTVGSLKSLIRNSRDGYNCTLLCPCCAVLPLLLCSILVNCAGRFLDEEFHLTTEGIEQTMALDYYAQTLITLRLLDTLSRNGPSRIINVSR